jgi:ribosomal protein S18 acetylase RimI-like enzyme
MIQTATQKDLTQIAICHREAFPNSVTSLFGIPFISQMLGWYLSAPNKFLFWIEENGICIGYCGGYIMDGSDGHGSATGMTQFGFNAAFKIMLRKPWLFFHPEIRGRYPFIVSNIKRKFKKILGIKENIKPTISKPKERNELTAGLVVIGVSRAMQKKGIGSLLQQEFERRAKQSGATRMELSVRVENQGAILSYKRNGWTIVDDLGISYLMTKTI